MRRCFPTLSLLLLVLLTPVVTATPASAAGGASQDATGTARAPETDGGAGYGQKKVRKMQARPVLRAFKVAPRRLYAGRPPRLAVRVDQLGVRTVHVRIVLVPIGRRRAALRLDLDRARTGTRLRPKWPSDATIEPGRYVVRVHATGPAGGSLRRTRRAPGREIVVVRARPKPQAPRPVVPPVAPPADGSGVFPVAGPHSFGSDGARFGAGRPGHIHEGQDVIAAEGVPVVAPTAGTITWRRYQAGGAGYYIVMDSVDGRSFFFAHCQRGSWAVSVGDTVTPGQRLCNVGQTGRASGPHLHFEIWTGGWRRDRSSAPVDPLEQLRAWDR